MNDQTPYTTPIFLVKGSLNRDGFKHSVKEIMTKETNKSYVSPNKRISKDNLMVPRTLIIQNHRNYFYYTYCLNGDQQKALDIINSLIIEQVSKIKMELDEVLVHLPEGDKEEVTP